MYNRQAEAVELVDPSLDVLPRPTAADGSAVSVRIEGKAFGSTPVLGRIALTLARGETVAISGGSGVGKSTLLRIIAGLDADFRGAVTAPDRVAMVFQEPTLLPWRSALRNLEITARIGSDEAASWLADVGLHGLEQHFPGQMSLGQQRRLSLARAFAYAPELLLMDEPFVSLDPALTQEMHTLFESLQAKNVITTLLVTHDRKEANRLAHRTLTLAGRPATIV